MSMERRRWKQTTRGVAFATALVVFALVPAGIAFAQNPVGDLLNGVNNSVKGILGGGGDDGGATQQQLPEPPDYQPPLHGDNPHGQGTVGTTDLLPSPNRPLSGDTDGGDGTEQEEIVVGRARGEQNEDGTYHGHVTILALFGTELFGVDSNPGDGLQSSPFDPLQTGLLDPLCEESMDNICIQLLVADSETTDDGSTNHFQLVDVQLGEEGAVRANVGESNGNISDDGTCQTAHGDSSVADIGFSETDVATVAQSESTSTACNDGTESSTQQDSSFLSLGGTPIGFPAEGCATGEPDTVFDLIVVRTICNADDENGIGESIVQAALPDKPYGVREAFTALVLPFMDTALLKATTAASESVAVAPPPDEPPPTTPTTPTPTDGGGGDDGRGGGPDDGGDDGGEGAGPAAGAAQAGDEDLAFTGADMLVLGLIGAALILGGLGLARASGRHSRAAA
jgi:hypothetical protein